MDLIKSHSESHSIRVKRGNCKGKGRLYSLLISTAHEQIDIGSKMVRMELQDDSIL